MDMPDYKRETSERWMILSVVLLSSFITPFMSSSVNIALPDIAGQLGLNAVMLNWVATSYLLATAVCLLPIGRIADIYGRARVFAIGMAVFFVSTLAAGLSQTITLLLAARVLQGVGSAFIFSTGIALLSDAYRPEVRGRMIGYSVAVVYIGLTAGPFLGGWLTGHYSWRMIFLVVAPFTAVAFLMSLRILSSEAKCENECVMDYPGSLAYAAGLSITIYGLSGLPEGGYFLTAAGFFILMAFVIREMSCSHPLLDLRLFTSNRLFLFSNLAALINYAATFATGFILSLYLQYIKGMSPEEAGLILISSPVVMAIIAPVSGRLSDRTGARIISSAGMAVTAMGLASFIFLTEKTGTPYIVVTLIVLGAGLGLFSSPNTNAIMGSVDKSSYGVASGMLATMRLMGQTLSMAFVMVMFSILIGRVEITPGYYPDFIRAVRMCFAFGTVLCMFGVFASLARD